jgi:hypothetical protein
MSLPSCIQLNPLQYGSFGDVVVNTVLIFPQLQLDFEHL